MPDDRYAATVATLEPVASTNSTNVMVLGEATRQGPRTETQPEHSDQILEDHEEAIRETFKQVTAERPVRQPSILYLATKRVLDLAIAIPVLVIALPLFIAVTVLIRLDSPGPALFIQPRVGKDGRIFRMFKFRTMVQNAGLLNGAVHKISGDSRVTRVGNFLRRTSIDELPQLVNVILGHMSLVGPRPELPEIVVTRYETWQYRRLAVPQGITGWWQVTGRGKKLLWKHTRDDIYYIENASFWFDLRLLLLTAYAVIRKDGAF